MAVRDVTLRPYQSEAVELMTARGRALLSLVMGAGKTVCSIAAVEQLVEEEAVRTGLVIVPASLKYQWQEQIKRFTGQAALVIDGTAPQRQKLYRLVPRMRYTIINYEAIVNDWKTVRDIHFDFLIVDEISYCKSMTTKRSRRTKFLSKRATVVYGLTGQPVENKAEELFSIMEVVDREVLGDFRKFDPAFIVRDHWGKPVRYRNLKLLHQTMSDVMYRKTREEIADQFPRVVSTLVPFDLSPTEWKIYSAAARYTLSRLQDAAERFGPGFSLEYAYGQTEDAYSNKVRGDIMAGLLMLRLAADDPLLIIDSSLRFKDEKSKLGSALAYEFHESGLLDRVADVSTKRALFREMLTQILEEDERNRIVVFSTFKDMIRRVQDDTASLSKSVQFTGDMNAWQKRKAMVKFRDDPECRLFLSSDAGGYGVDLPEANYLISLDLPWSTGKMEQREARIIRISSEWEHIDLHSLLARHTIEERMHELIVAKKGVSGAFVDGQFDSQGSYTPSIGTLTEFLTQYV